MTDPYRIDKVRKRNPKNLLCEYFIRVWILLSLCGAWQSIVFADHPADRNASLPQPDILSLSDSMAEPISPIDAPKTLNINGHVKLGENCSMMNDWITKDAELPAPPVTT